MNPKTSTDIDDAAVLEIEEIDCSEYAALVQGANEVSQLARPHTAATTTITAAERNSRHLCHRSCPDPTACNAIARQPPNLRQLNSAQLDPHQVEGAKGKIVSYRIDEGLVAKAVEKEKAEKAAAAAAAAAKEVTAATTAGGSKKGAKADKGRKRQKTEPSVDAGAAGGAAGGATTSSLAKELTELKGLHDAGVLSDDEFKQQKQDVLALMTKLRQGATASAAASAAPAASGPAAATARTASDDGEGEGEKKEMTRKQRLREKQKRDRREAKEKRARRAAVAETKAAEGAGGEQAAVAAVGVEINGEGTGKAASKTTPKQSKEAKEAKKKKKKKKVRGRTTHYRLHMRYHTLRYYALAPPSPPAAAFRPTNRHPLPRPCWSNPKSPMRLIAKPRRRPWYWWGTTTTAPPTRMARALGAGSASTPSYWPRWNAKASRARRQSKRACCPWR